MIGRYFLDVAIEGLELRCFYIDRVDEESNRAILELLEVDILSQEVLDRRRVIKARPIVRPFLAAYLWSLGAKVLRAREFPPPGHRVIRDTPVITLLVGNSRALSASPELTLGA